MCRSSKQYQREVTTDYPLQRERVRHVDAQNLPGTKENAGEL